MILYINYVKILGSSPHGLPNVAFDNSSPGYVIIVHFLKQIQIYFFQLSDFMLFKYFSNMV